MQKNKNNWKQTICSQILVHNLKLQLHNYYYTSNNYRVFFN